MQALTQWSCHVPETTKVFELLEYLPRHLRKIIVKWIMAWAVVHRACGRKTIDLRAVVLLSAPTIIATTKFQDSTPGALLRSKHVGVSVHAAFLSIVVYQAQNTLAKHGRLQVPSFLHTYA